MSEDEHMKGRALEKPNLRTTIRRLRGARDELMMASQSRGTTALGTNLERRKDVDEKLKAVNFVLGELERWQLPKAEWLAEGGL